MAYTESKSPTLKTCNDYCDTKHRIARHSYDPYGTIEIYLVVETNPTPQSTEVEHGNVKYQTGVSKLYCCHDICDEVDFFTSYNIL